MSSLNRPATPRLESLRSRGSVRKNVRRKTMPQIYPHARAWKLNNRWRVFSLLKEAFERRRKTEVLAQNRQALEFLTHFKPTRPCAQADIPRTPVEFPRGCSSRTGRGRPPVRQWARRPSRATWHQFSLS